ncbi:SOSS complex subunit B1 [Cimex lectularius]|uniref:Uncharacterized protein n=1 Tax=Cimex lectularius TaxID=79782 RepID=A0A8I6RLL4_CIMLE|nr:SOSS complex subunit B1 [Cimex lectularius]
MDILIKDLRPGMKNMNLTVIVLDVGNPIPVKEREVRTLKVADTSACINLCLWDDPGRYLYPGDIVRLTKAHVNMFRSCLTLYSGKAGDIDKLGEFCMVFNEQLNMSEPNMNFDVPQGMGQGMNNGGPAGLSLLANNNGGKGGAGMPPAGLMGAKPQGSKLPPQRSTQDPQPLQGKNQPKVNNKNSRGPMKGNIVRTERR